MLAEFKYGLEPKESFASYLGDQSIPRAAFYYLKKDFFPWVYWNYMVRTPMSRLKGAKREKYHRSRVSGSDRRVSSSPLSASRCTACRSK